MQSAEINDGLLSLSAKYCRQAKKVIYHFFQNYCMKKSEVPLIGF